MDNGLFLRFFFLHGAAIGGLLFKASGESMPSYLSALWWFVFGIILALAAGFSAWWNFTFAANQYYEWCDFRMLTDHKYWPKPANGRAISATMWIAVITGLLSAMCLLGGAFAVVCSWR